MARDRSARCGRAYFGMVRWGMKNPAKYGFTPALIKVKCPRRKAGADSLAAQAMKYTRQDFVGTKSCDSRTASLVCASFS